MKLKATAKPMPAKKILINCSGGEDVHRTAVLQCL